MARGPVRRRRPRRRGGWPRHAILLLVAIGVLGACSGVRTVPREDIPASEAGEAGQGARLAGAYVRVLLPSGEKVSGQVRGIKDGFMTLERPRDYSFRERAIPTAVVTLVLVALSQIMVE